MCFLLIFNVLRYLSQKCNLKYFQYFLKIISKKAKMLPLGSKNKIDCHPGKENIGQPNPKKR